MQMFISAQTISAFCLLLVQRKPLPVNIFRQIIQSLFRGTRAFIPRGKICGKAVVAAKKRKPLLFEEAFTFTEFRG